MEEKKKKKQEEKKKKEAAQKKVSFLISCNPQAFTQNLLLVSL